MKRFNKGFFFLCFCCLYFVSINVLYAGTDRFEKSCYAFVSSFIGKKVETLIVGEDIKAFSPIEAMGIFSSIHLEIDQFKIIEFDFHVRGVPKVFKGYIELDSPGQVIVAAKLVHGDDVFLGEAAFREYFRHEDMINQGTVKLLRSEQTYRDAEKLNLPVLNVTRIQDDVRRGVVAAPTTGKFPMSQVIFRGYLRNRNISDAIVVTNYTAVPVGMYKKLDFRVGQERLTLIFHGTNVIYAGSSRAAPGRMTKIYGGEKGIQRFLKRVELDRQGYFQEGTYKVSMIQAEPSCSNMEKDSSSLLIRIMQLFSE